MQPRTNWFKVGVIGITTFVVIMMVLFGLWVVVKTVSRSQKRADARNEVTVQNTLIRATEAQANRRYAEAVGIKRAQDEISKTLTPLYVQHEAIQHLPDARAIYVPSGAQGIPQVYDIANGDHTGGDK